METQLNYSDFTGFHQWLLKFSGLDTIGNTLFEKLPSIIRLELLHKYLRDVSKVYIEVIPLHRYLDNLEHSINPYGENKPNEQEWGYKLHGEGIFSPEYQLTHAYMRKSSSPTYEEALIKGIKEAYIILK